MEEQAPEGHMSPRMRNSSSDPKPGHMAEAPGVLFFTILTGCLPPSKEGPGGGFPACSPNPTVGSVLPSAQAAPGRGGVHL